MRWFPRQKGLVNGVIVGGFGLGAFVFNQIQSTYLNPTNEKLDDDNYFSDDKILNRVPSVFLLLGSIYGIVQVSPKKNCSLPITQANFRYFISPDNCPEIFSFFFCICNPLIF